MLFVGIGLTPDRRAKPVDHQGLMAGALALGERSGRFQINPKARVVIGGRRHGGRPELASQTVQQNHGSIGVAALDRDALLRRILSADTINPVRKNLCFGTLLVPFEQNSLAPRRVGPWNNKPVVKLNLRRIGVYHFDLV